MARRDLDELAQQASRQFQAGRLDEALASCRRILEIQPGRPDILGFAGMVALKQGDNPGAARFYGAAVKLRPDFAEAHYNLGNALKNQGLLNEAAEAYRTAARLRPDLAPAYHNLGNVLHALEQFDAAAEAYRQVLDLAPNVAETHRNLGIVLQRSGRLQEAAVAYRGAIERQPDWFLAYSNLATLLMELGDMPGLVALCDRWLSTLPGHLEALAFKALALVESGERAAARRLLDFDRLVQLTTPDAPPGYPDMAAFNAALAAHVEAHPTLKVPPEDDPTYHHPRLLITDELLVEPKGPMAPLEAAMRQAVDTYRATVSADAEHPFLANWPPRWRLASWGVVLQGEGNLVPHVHLEGYLSGVYYVEIPEEIASAEATGQAGWFELGRPPDELHCKAAPETRAIQPANGLMLLFPAYMYHCTIPFDLGRKRISIAFDVVPED